MTATLAGTGALARLALRRDRFWWPAWIVPIVLYLASLAAGFEGLYPTEELRQTLPGSMGRNPTLVAMYGPAWDITTPGGFTVWRAGWFALILVALMSMFAVLRHTRDEEESGRLELIRSAAVGRHASLAAALLVTLGGNLVVMLGTAAGMAAVGTPVVGSMALGAALAATGLTFAGVGAVTAQLSESARTARGLGLSVLGATFLLRMVGDSTSGLSFLVWLSPIGWANQVRPYAGDRFVVVLLPVLVTAALVVAAWTLESRRDFAAGVLEPRLGPARAPSQLSTPMGLAWRLLRGSLLAWTIGLVAIGVTLGTIANGVLELFEDNPILADILRQLGGDQGVVDAYLAAVLPMLTLIGSVQGISAVLGIRAEETEGRAELALATDVTRPRYASSFLALALLGSVTVVAAMGLSAGIGYAVVAGDPSGVWHVFGASLVPLPAVWVLIGFALALVGVVPRWTALAWMGIALSLLLGQFGRLLSLPEWALQLTPYAHLPQAPGPSLNWTPLILLTAVAAALVAVGLAGFRRRDIG